MSVQSKPKGMWDDDTEVMFVLRDPEKRYALHEVVAILSKAEEAGLSLEKGSYLEFLTVGQLDALVNDARKCDA